MYILYIIDYNTSLFSDKCRLLHFPILVTAFFGSLFRQEMTKMCLGRSFGVSMGWESGQKLQIFTDDEQKILHN